ncbi:MAG: hypothetical protein Q4C44_03745, partial [bacterium]|nr:hypothetical protein [bacterium]
MKSKDNKIKIYTGLLITVICIIGISYAWFRLYLRQSENNKIASRNCFSTTLTEDSAKIDLVDAVSMYDEEGLEETPFTFTIKNNCSGYVKAYITIDSQYRDSSSSSYLKDDFVKVNISPKGTINGPSVVLTDKNLIDLDNSRKGYLIVDAGLNSNEERSFDLRIWMDSETTAAQGVNKTWLGKIVVVTQASNIASPDGWNGAANGTLLSAIKRDNNVSEPLTTPSSEISADTEAVLASTVDDYGTSYYFRGAVTNNFVEYANMCWRIVRVTGDGSIKLVLYNYNGLTDSNMTPSSSTPCNVTGDDYAFARYEGDTYRSKFNSNYNDNAYVGFMYGTIDASSYVAAHANTNQSIILANLNKWYTNVLSKQTSFSDNQLADTIWCNDKSVVTDTAFNPGSWTLGTNYGYAKNGNYYGTAKRLVQASSLSAGGTGPSLICLNDNLGGKLSKLTVNDTEYGNGALDKKVGILTADEVMFAGGAYGISNSSYYIKGNTNLSYWWALSPGGFNGVVAYFWVVGGGSFLGFGDVSGNRGVRPSLSLSSGVKISAGD